MKKRLLYLTPLVLVGFLYLEYYLRNDCGQPMGEVRKQEGWRETRSTSTPFRDWKGTCFVRVRAQERYLKGERAGETITGILIYRKTESGRMTLVSQTADIKK